MIKEVKNDFIKKRLIIIIKLMISNNKNTIDILKGN